MKKLIILRRLSQIIFLGFFVYILWSTTYPLKGFISPQIIFKLDPLIMFATAVSERTFLPGLILSLAMIFLTAILGRFFCGWICPLGTFIDMSGALRKRQRILNDNQNRKIRRMKYFFLGTAVFLAAMGVQIAWVLDPVVLVARVVSLNVIPGTTFLLDKLFISFIQNFKLYGTIYDFYRALKASFLGINIHFFVNSLVTFIVFVLLCAMALIFSRAWCRACCPLGALYAWTARFSWLERVVRGCKNCRRCQKVCRMGAIEKNAGYVKGECILCMDCIYTCPAEATRFSFRNKFYKTLSVDGVQGISRREFIFWVLACLPLMGFRRLKFISGRVTGNVIRPPGALAEGQFLNTCVRCGNCMKVCITNGLQPVMLQSGLQGLWTPQLIPEIGYCEYQCTLCGDVCPTQAIPSLPLEKKVKIKLGVAQIDRSLCIAWAENKQCIVCEEHCPVPDKAIKTQEEVVSGQKIYKPRVVQELCIGCGICQNKCPVLPVRAIRVNAALAQRGRIKILGA